MLTCLRSSSPKLLINPRCSGNDQAHCFEQNCVPAAQVATQELRIRCEPSKTAGEPKINRAKGEHFPPESHGQVKPSPFWAGSQEAAHIHLLCHWHRRLWLCCSRGAPIQPGRKRAPPGRQSLGRRQRQPKPHGASSQGSGPPPAAHRRGSSLRKTGMGPAELRMLNWPLPGFWASHLPSAQPNAPAAKTVVIELSCLKDQVFRCSRIPD